MTAAQKEILLHILDNLPYNPSQVNITKTLEKAHELITGNSHDYSVLAFLGNIDVRAVPLFEFNTNSLTDAKGMFEYWRERLRTDAMLILQDNHATDSFMAIRYGKQG